MAKTVSSVCVNVLYRLGDSTEDIWKTGEIHRYLKEGYDLLAVKTGCFWDTIYLEDSETTANTTAPFEADYLQAGDAFYGRFSYTAPWEKEYVGPGEQDYGPTNHTAKWETDYIAEHYYKAVHDLPDGLIEIERATWGDKRIDPMRSVELEWGDSQYQTQNGPVIGYLQEKDGIGRFRKWRVPSQVADKYTITGNWGLLRGPADLTSETVLGTWGIARRIPGQHPAGGSYPWGFPRRPWKAAYNTKIEYTRKGQLVDELADTFELPDRYVKYLRHYAMARALERNGLGQDSRLSAFWMGLFDAGVARIIRRKSAALRRKAYVLTGESRGSARPPLARYPAGYGRMIPWP